VQAAIPAGTDSRARARPRRAAWRQSEADWHIGSAQTRRVLQSGPGAAEHFSVRTRFDAGQLTFAGDFSPQFDFLATTQAGGASVSIAVTGNPADPQFIFRSSADLPQDEILSRLLFGAPSSQLSPTQALALGQAAAIYSGGNDALEGLRRSLGFGAASNSHNPLNKFLGDRVSLGVHTGATHRGS
jgi:hypothetical protein